MKKILIALVLFAVLVSSCSMPPDKSKPWKDDSGMWHENYTCSQKTGVWYSYIKIRKTTIYMPHYYTYEYCRYE